MNSLEAIFETPQKEHVVVDTGLLLRTPHYISLALSAMAERISRDVPEGSQLTKLHITVGRYTDVPQIEDAYEHPQSEN